MKRLRSLLDPILYSLPIRLLIIQLQQYKLLLISWLVLLGMVSGKLGEGLGFTYLYLEPEYLGQEGFWAVFLVGATLGAFVYAYLITLFINESYRFHFIAYTRHPFLAFSLNNFLLPGLLLAIYYSRFIAFHVDTQGSFNGVVWEQLGGLFIGMSVVIAFLSLYFFAAHRGGLLQALADTLEQQFEKARGAKNRRVIIEKARQSVRGDDESVKYYLDSPISFARVPERHLNLRQVVRVLNQHHGRLLLLMIGVFAVIAMLGLGEGDPAFLIPAGASIILVLSLVLLAAGAITFWFRKAGVLPLLLLLLALFLYDRPGLWQQHHHAFGMNYEAPPARYEHEVLSQLVEAHYQADRLSTLAMLDRWREAYQRKHGLKKPRAVFVCSTGGGLRSSYWNLMILQRLDSATQGVFTDNIRMFSGASGGMFGTSYFRELVLRRSLGEPIDLHDPRYLDNISSDLLNRIGFRLFTDLILPNGKVQLGGKSYENDRGYAFDESLQRNLPELRGRRLSDYRQHERSGAIPPLVLTPSIANQGRKLFISSTPVSFLARQQPITMSYVSKAEGVEFRRLFANHQPDSLLFATALRMNATFPFVLPVVELPSQPKMLVMDAGAIDNYGVQLPLRYLFEFRDWFAKNTSGVVFLQIRDNARHDPIEKIAEEGMLRQNFSPFSGGYKAMLESREMLYDRMLEVVQEWYAGPVEIFTFEYPQETSDRPASICFHLTQREQNEVANAFYTSFNQTTFSRIVSLYQPQVKASRTWQNGGELVAERK